MEAYSPLLYPRKLFKLEDLGKFKIPSRCFDQQFCGIYKERFKALKNDVLEEAKNKWGDHEILTLSQLSKRNETKTCIIAGTLYKHQELKRSILHDLSGELQLEAQPAKTNYASFKDKLYLEDETLRVILVGNNMNIQDVVTGIICAVLGHELENGAFSVMDWCFAGCCPNLLTTGQPQQEKGKILLISGLNIANSTQLLSLDLLSEWITGMIGGNEMQEEVASIVCIIIAGNVMRGTVETHNYKEYFQTKDQQMHMFKDATMVIHKIDNFLCQIVQCCPILLMPGDYDPSNHALPQQPVHPSILPKCSR